MNGSVSGVQTLHGTLDSTLAVAGIEICIDAGAGFPSPGDNASFRTSRLLGNVSLEPFEIATEYLVSFTVVGGAR